MLDDAGKTMTTDGQTGYALAFPADPALAPGTVVQGRGPAAADEAVVDRDTFAERKLGLGQTINVLDSRQQVRHFSWSASPSTASTTAPTAGPWSACCRT